MDLYCTLQTRPKEKCKAFYSSSNLINFAEFIRHHIVGGISSLECDTPERSLIDRYPNLDFSPRDVFAKKAQRPPATITLPCQKCKASVIIQPPEAVDEHSVITREVHCKKCNNSTNVSFLRTPLLLPHQHQDLRMQRSGVQRYIRHISLKRLVIDSYKEPTLVFYLFPDSCSVPIR